VPSPALPQTPLHRALGPLLRPSTRSRPSSRSTWPPSATPRRPVA
jgi:hypothetical protein